jgi:Zn-dependent M32 family carboxypeptidase
VRGRQVREAYELSRRVPVRLVTELNILKSVAQQYWDEAKERNDFNHFAPSLERMMEMTQVADYIGFQDHPYDACCFATSRATVARLKKSLEKKETILLSCLHAQASLDFRSRLPEKASERFLLSCLSLLRLNRAA